MLMRSDLCMPCVHVCLSIEQEVGQRYKVERKVEGFGSCNWACSCDLDEVSPPTRKASSVLERGDFRSLPRSLATHTMAGQKKETHFGPGYSKTGFSDNAQIMMPFGLLKMLLRVDMLKKRRFGQICVNATFFVMCAANVVRKLLLL